MLVLSGRNTAITAAARVTACLGDVMLLPAGQVIDLVNDPGPEGVYESISVVLEPAAAEFRDDALRTVTSAESLPAVGFRAAILRACEVMLDEAVPLPVARHVAAEVTAWPVARGVRFDTDPTRTFAERLRVYVSGRPDAVWNTEAAADIMAVSEATLLRRLARSSLSLTGLLQASDDTVLQIALACGYGDHAYFSRCFRERFGITPTEFRAPARLSDRIAATTDRQVKAGGGGAWNPPVIFPHRSPPWPLD